MFIGAEKLTYTYMPGTPFSAAALHEVSFSLDKGAFALLIGPSGSGKSTLVQHLNGLLKPTDGRVFFEGKVIGESKRALLELRRRVGLVFQSAEDHFFAETVYDEVAFAPRNLGLVEEEVRGRVEKALAAVGFDPTAISVRRPFQLSAGQKRLAAIAAVLALEPEALVLDEPTAGLDTVGRTGLFRLLERLNHERNMTVIIATHHLEEAAGYADKVLVLNAGRLVLEGSPEAVFTARTRLEEWGLETPRIAALMLELSAAGLPVASNVFSLDGARREIMKQIRRRHR